MSVVTFVPGFALINGDDLNLNFGLVLPVQRSVAIAAQVTILPGDFFINMNLTQSFNWPLPRSATRNGKPLIFVDAGLQCGAFPQTLTPFGSELIVNWTSHTSLLINTAGAVVAIHPFSDGVNNGWFVA